MTHATVVLGVVLLLLLSAVFSGSETGIYTLGRVQLEAEAKRGGRIARLLRWLVAGDALLLITLLIGNNLALELLSHLVRHHFQERGWFDTATLELAVAMALTPLVFLFGELLPKDSFRRRPRVFLGLAAGVLVLARIAFLPLALPLRWLSVGLERLFGVEEDELTRALGREEVLELLRIGARQGHLEEDVGSVAENVFVLRSTSVETVMSPWERVVHVALHDPELRATLEASNHTRVPAVDEDGSWNGYLHQLDVLGAPERDPRELVRPLPALAPGLSVDRALVRMQLTGQRVALVGTPEAPLGLVSLMDLVAVIAGVRAT